MSVYELNPIEDKRWATLVASHPQASIFHSPSWLKALQGTYGYETFALTSSAPGQELQNGLVFCRIKSLLTGSRIVSLPFSDHCDPLVRDENELLEILHHLQLARKSTPYKYLELRPTMAGGTDDSMGEGESFWLHCLDLNQSLDEIFKSFHKSCVQRKIRRAEKDGITCSHGRSKELLDAFYSLLLLTRRRHQLPPQPRAWFENLISGFGDALQIWIAFSQGRPIAGILTIHDARTMVYKYGCSNAEFHNLGGMPLLFWQAMQHAKQLGLRNFDFGRSEKENESLAAFKEHLGGTRTSISYLRFPNLPSRKSSSSRLDVARKAFSILPDFCLVSAGNLLYKHIG